MVETSKFKKYLRKKLYHEETGFYLNYLTLKIEEPSIAKELKEHIVNQFKRIYWPVTIFIVAAFVVLVILYLKSNGHPVSVVTGGCSVLIMVILSILIRCK